SAPRPRSPQRHGRRVLSLGMASVATAVFIVWALPARAPELAPPPSVASGFAPSPAPVVPAAPAARELAAEAGKWISAPAPLRDELSALKSDTLRGTRAALHLAFVTR